QVLGEAAAGAKQWLRDRTRSLRQRSSQLRRLYRTRGLTEEERRAARQQIYAGLLAVARKSRAQGEKVLAARQERAAARGATGGSSGASSCSKKWKGGWSAAMRCCRKPMRTGSTCPRACSGTSSSSGTRPTWRRRTGASLRLRTGRRRAEPG